MSMALPLRLPNLSLSLSSFTSHGSSYNSNPHASPTPSLNSSHSFSLSPLSPSLSSSSRFGFATLSSYRSYRVSYRYSGDDDEDDDHGGEGEHSFDEAVMLFNEREYYKCHDFLESLWNRAEEPKRTLFHGILQCAVGFHHLFNKNHKGAMMELGEGLCKLRKMNFESGPFHQFEQEISAALDFIYQTQIELAACSEDLCIAMDRSERSYQLLGGYAAGQEVYHLQVDPNKTTYIVFLPERTTSKGDPPRIKLPFLEAAEENLSDI